ncbi:hypothetical protein COLO4_05859 [Corchorus olitorius]|uniref:Uncharacterized protein n=1 Tax=Corchorus olitorius TaxID=93759 RepID=A0A1R3KPN5_9ROSI|nr:hypothetical protein COLO4_05859 [Corchorus olitorius]
MKGRDESKGVKNLLVGEGDKDQKESANVDELASLTG